VLNKLVAEETASSPMLIDIKTRRTGVLCPGIVVYTVRSKSHRNFKMSISQSNKKINEKNKKWF